MNFHSRTALAATGFIWVRYSVVITPVNYSLAAVRVDAVPSSSPFSFYLFIGELLRWFDRFESAVQDLGVRVFYYHSDDAILTWAPSSYRRKNPEAAAAAAAAAS